MRNYSIHHCIKRHLNFEERKVIQRVWNDALNRSKSSISIRAIAIQLGLSNETLRRELKKGWEYQPYKLADGTTVYAEYSARRAEDKYQDHLRQKGPRQKMTTSIAKAFKDEMSPDGTISPETARHRMELKGLNPPCVSTLYNHIHQGDLGMDESWLPHKRRPRHKKKSIPRPGKHSQDGYCIDDTPPEHLDRETFGTWEMDTVVSGKGRKGGVLVLIERKTRFYIVRKLYAISQKAVHKQLRKLMRQGILKHVNAIITDNGCEFLDHSQLDKIFKAHVYYTHAYSSWEKGSVENANGILRRFFPKATNFADVSPTQLEAVQTQINNIYRRTSLKGQTAHEAFSSIAA